MASAYNANGVKLRHSFPCPKCRHPHAPVIVTRQTDDGEVIRRRGCPECGHRWFTLQEPEFLLPQGAVKWSGQRLLLKREPA